MARKKQDNPTISHDPVSTGRFFAFLLALSGRELLETQALKEAAARESNRKKRPSLTPYTAGLKRKEIYLRGFCEALPKLIHKLESFPKSKRQEVHDLTYRAFSVGQGFTDALQAQNGWLLECGVKVYRGGRRAHERTYGSEFKRKERDAHLLSERAKIERKKPGLTARAYDEETAVACNVSWKTVQRARLKK